ncbi:MAG: protein kinase domain-containing protein, partial [Gemmataceae bacterium]
LLKNLDHANINSIITARLKGRDGREIPFDKADDPAYRANLKELIIVMGLAEMSLAVRLKQQNPPGTPPERIRGLPVPEVITYLRGVAKGIDFLNLNKHDRPVGGSGPIIHRDIKPENLFLFGQAVKIGDCGLAVIVTQDAQKTRIGGMGTYTAPELIRNQPTLGTDQYSLAVTYFELRTGHPPFASNISPYQIVQLHLEGGLNFNDPQIFPEEIRVLKKATSVKPEDRYESCEKFMRAMSRAVESLLDQSVNMTPQSSSEVPVLSFPELPANPAPPSRRTDRVFIEGLVETIVPGELMSTPIVPPASTPIGNSKSTENPTPAKAPNIRETATPGLSPELLAMLGGIEAGPGPVALPPLEAPVVPPPPVPTRRPEPPIAETIPVPVPVPVPVPARIIPHLSTNVQLPAMRRPEPPPAAPVPPAAPIRPFLPPPPPPAPRDIRGTMSYPVDDRDAYKQPPPPPPVWAQDVATGGASNSRVAPGLPPQAENLPATALPFSGESAVVRYLARLAPRQASSVRLEIPLDQFRSWQRSAHSRRSSSAFEAGAESAIEAEVRMIGCDISPSRDLVQESQGGAGTVFFIIPRSKGTYAGQMLLRQGGKILAEIPLLIQVKGLATVWGIVAVGVLLMLLGPMLVAAGVDVLPKPAGVILGPAIGIFLMILAALYYFLMIAPKEVITRLPTAAPAPVEQSNSRGRASWNS